MLNRAHLEIIKEIQEAGSLSNAATNLCLTQSALSHSIKKLEASLNTKIWVREGHKLRLTESGQSLLELARRILPEIEHCEKVISEVTTGKRGTLRIGMECHPCYRWLQAVITPFLKEWHSVDVDIKQQFQFDGLSALCSYELDLLITPDPVVAPRINFIPVFDYELVLVLPTTHDLAEKPYLDPEDLRNETLLTYPVAQERLDIYNYFLNSAFVKPATHKTLESTEIMLQMVAAGRGVTALPRWLVEQYIENLTLTVKPLGRKGIFKKIYLGIHDENLEILFIKRFIEMAAENPPTSRGVFKSGKAGKEGSTSRLKSKKKKAK